MKVQKKIIIAFGNSHTMSLFFNTKKVSPNELTLYGNIEIRQVDLSFQVSGQIKNKLKKEDDSVKKGELVTIWIYTNLNKQLSYYTWFENFVPFHNKNVAS